LAGIYIHIPFCKQACTYCNFHFSTQLKHKNEFVTALKNEISVKDDFINRGETVETIYFGGGTPSLLDRNEINDILSVIHSEFNIHSNAEITLEANPDDISRDAIKQWTDSGINRLSVGIQSFVEAELKWMNRAHDSQQAADCIDIIQEGGITNFSVDLIFGGPLLSNENLIENISIITEKNIPHVSCYAMTVEEKTALHHQIKTKKWTGVDSEKQAEQFFITMETLKASGYEHYEISNYAKQGMRSQHNSSYWKNKPYWGFGPSAHAYNGKDKRRWNISNNATYISNLINNKPVFELETLTSIQQLNERIMTSIRTLEGIDLNVIKKEFGEEMSALISKKSIPYVKSGKITVSPNNIVLTENGKLFADGIAAALFFE